MSVNRYIGIVSYTVILVFFFYSLRRTSAFGKNKDVDIPDEIKVQGQFGLCFFTLWTFGLQILFLITAIVDEAFKLLNFPVQLQKRVGRFRAFLFNTFVFPCSLLVMTIFWSLWHIDRELIFPRALDAFFPSWLNHTLHTFIVVPLLIELVLPKKYSFVKFRRAAVALTAYTTIYQLIYFSIYLRHGIWLYGIYGKLNWPERLVFSIFQLALCLVYQKIGIDIQDSKKRSNDITRKNS